MYDTALNDQFPAGAAAYAGYVDGGVGDQPNYAYVVRTFPKAEHLSIALFADNNADALDVEPGASAPSDIPGWYARQVARGVQRPVIYASASTMNDSILPVLSQAGIARARTRLWSAHYGLGEHICGPRSCGALSVDADGTQWTSSARGLVLDQSLLLENFFAPANQQGTERHGGRIAVRAAQQWPRVFTVIAVPPGSAHHNRARGRQSRAERAGSSGCAWRSSTRPGTSTRTSPSTATSGLGILAFPNAAKTGMVSVRRNDAGNAAVGYVVY